MSDQRFYRNPDWLMATERRFALARLSRADFRRALALLALVAVLAGLLLVQRTQVVKVSYEVDLLRAKRSEMKSLDQRLQNRVDELESMATAEQVARQSLGMASADPGKVIYLSPQGFGPRALWSRMARAFKP